MSDTDTPIRRPGPWDPRPDSAPAEAAPTTAAAAPAEKDQNLVWTVASTLLMAAFLWWITGSVIVAGAVLIGLFVHEAGHALAMNRLGMGPARVYIIPFLGGLAQARREPQSEWHGVLVSLAGPAFGLLAMIPFAGVWMATGQGEWLIGAFFMVWWGLTTGRFILAAFLALAVFSHLKRGVWRPAWGTLSWPEAGRSLALYLATGALCAVAAVGALLPVADGDPAEAIRLGLSYLGVR